LKMKPSAKPEDDLVLPDIAKQIRDATKELNPKKGNEYYVLGTEFGAWTLDKPGQYNEIAAQPGAQVTAGFPMEGAYCHYPENYVHE